MIPHNTFAHNMDTDTDTDTSTDTDMDTDSDTDTDTKRILIQKQPHEYGICDNHLFFIPMDVVDDDDDDDDNNDVRRYHIIPLPKS